MDKNGANVSSDADITDCDGEKVVTMMDVLQEQQDFEDDANAVLGASDEKNCTYQKGYVKRQAIYACLTCCSEVKHDETKRAGVCLACSLSCHENHELIELYTKRNFRCDCGNPKFNSTCQFTPNKPDLNEENSYNQNFTGLYCVCHRPYPDPEAVEEDEMIQCIICEDWLHSAHLEALVPPVEQYAEMICKSCINKNEFLQDYIDNAVNLDEDILSDNPELSIVNVTSITNDTDILDDTNEASKSEDIICGTAMEVKDNDIITNSEQIDTKSCDEHNNAKPKDETNTIISTSNEQIKDVPNTSEIEPDHHASITNPKDGDNLDNTLTQDDTINTNEKIDTEIKANDNIEQKEMPAESPSEEPDEVPCDTTIDGKEPDVNDSADNIEKKESQEDNTCNNKLINSNDDYTDSTGSLGEPFSKTTDEQTNPVSVNGNHESNKRKIELEVDEVSKKIKLNEMSDKNDCLRPKKGKKTFKGASFWPSNFRQKLCTCNECISMYKDLNVLYLIDLDDTVSAYEMLGQEKTNGTATQYEKGLEALSSLDRVQQINALTEYNNMRDKLLDFLKSFKDRKEIVKEDDIKAFFAGMKAKREPDGVYFCR